MITRVNEYGAILVTREPSDPPEPPSERKLPDGPVLSLDFIPDDEDFFDKILEDRERGRRMAIEEQRRMRRERGLPELPPEEE